MRGIPFEVELPIELFDTFKLLYLIDLGICKGFNSYAFQHAAEDFKLMDRLDGDKLVFWS